MNKMERIKAKSKSSAIAYELIESLQKRFVDKLSIISKEQGSGEGFSPVEWFRDEGKHGGGVRYEGRDEVIFNRASVNLSQVQYDDDDSKGLASATAISTIIHPKNPLAPSVHLHFSWTEMKDGKGYWRLMADLNPSNENTADKEKFANILQQSAPEQYQEASDQGDKYFYIPALGRHRGITHFYLEAYNTGDNAADIALTKKVAEAAIDAYVDILNTRLASKPIASDEESKRQLDYHTLYLFQVLTLDRGTTSGLMVHNQNDVGIMGSIPSHINKTLLASWEDKMQPPQDALLRTLVSCLPEGDICLVDETVKQKLAEGVRSHYKKYPEAINMQASGNTTPPTVANHK